MDNPSNFSSTVQLPSGFSQRITQDPRYLAAEVLRKSQQSSSRITYKYNLYSWVDEPYNRCSESDVCCDLGYCSLPPNEIIARKYQPRSWF